MKFQIILTNIILQVSTINNYQTGENHILINSHFSQSTPYTYNINFYWTFAHVPQVAIYPIQIEAYWNQTSLEMGYRISVTQITNSNFQVTIYANTTLINYLYISWIAVDDQRVEILCNFNSENFASPQYLQHINPNAKNGIILLTSFHGKTEIDFTINLGTINETTVEVLIEQQNMLSLGYTVILGPAGFQTIVDEITLPPLNEDKANVYFSRYVDNGATTTWPQFYRYFSFKVIGNLRIQLQQQFTDGWHITYRYKFSTWDNPNITFTKCVHQFVFMNFTLFVFQPITLQNVRITTNLLKQTNTIEIYIPEANKAYTESVNNDVITIVSDFEAFTIKFMAKCNQNKKQITALLYNLTSANNYTKINRYCYSSELSLIYSAKFKAQQGQEGQAKQISTTMTQTQVQIYYIMLNYISSQILIAQFQIQ